MFKNVGKNIKTLVKILFVIEVISCFITGFALIGTMPAAWWIGVSVLFLGPLVAWIATWLLYGYGEIIDKLICIERNTRGNLNGEFKSEVQINEENERNARIEKLRAQGLINEEEYQKAMAKSTGTQQTAPAQPKPTAPTQPQQAATNAEDERIKKIQKLYEQGLITEEEYKNKLTTKE